jgi:hypothetical protein
MIDIVTKPTDKEETDKEVAEMLARRRRAQS